MSDKQFFKGAVCGVLCASLVLGGGYVGLQNYAKAGSGLLSDVAVTQKIKYLEDVIEQDHPHPSALPATYSLYRPFPDKR